MDDQTGLGIGVDASERASRSELPRASKGAWAALAVIVVAALAVPLLPGDRVVFEDDFAGPSTLRRWPETSGSTYQDGAYHQSVTTDEDARVVYNTLNQSLDAMELDLDVRAVEGIPAVFLMCISGVDDLTASSPVEGSAYSFVVVPGTGEYAILSPTGHAIAKGSASPSSELRHVSVGCAADSSGTADLTMSVSGGRPIEGRGSAGFESFDGIGFATYALEAPVEAAFDNVEVTQR